MARRRKVTLVVEEDLLRQARVVAAQRRTTVNAMVREFLQDVVHRDSQRLEALERIRPLLERPTVHQGGRRASRDELYER